MQVFRFTESLRKFNSNSNGADAGLNFSVISQ